MASNANCRKCERRCECCSLRDSRIDCYDSQQAADYPGECFSLDRGLKFCALSGEKLEHRIDVWDALFDDDVMREYVAEHIS